MQLPHAPNFAYRRQIVLSAVVIGAIAAGCWPALEIRDRILAPAAIVAMAAIYYFLALGLIRLQALVSSSLRRPAAYVVFYGAVIVSLAFPFIAIFARHDLLAEPPLKQALTFGGVIPSALAAAAGAFRELQTHGRAT